LRGNGLCQLAYLVLAATQVVRVVRIDQQPFRPHQPGFRRESLLDKPSTPYQQQQDGCDKQLDVRGLVSIIQKVRDGLAVIPPRDNETGDGRNDTGDSRDDTA